MNQQPSQPPERPSDEQTTQKGWAYFFLCAYFVFEFIRPQAAYLPAA